MKALNVIFNTPMINIVSVNNVNLVLQQKIASGKDFCISLTKAVEIDVIEKLNTSMINVVL